MILYHESDCIVDAPEILESDRFLDFGVGFYTTKNKEQAIRWANKVSARRKSSKQFISIYDFDFDKAKNDEAIKRLKVETLFNQVLFHTKRALKILSFKEYVQLGDAANG